MKNKSDINYGEIIKDVFWKFFYQEKLSRCKSIYHYTDLSALINGIIVQEPKEGKEICLWATRCTHMNDKKELKEGLQSAIHSLLESFECKNEETIDAVKGAANRAYADVKSSHIISFSMTKDSLPMWNTYGHNASGVMLVFDVDAMHNAAKFIVPCIYKKRFYYEQCQKRFKYFDILPDYDVPDNVFSSMEFAGTLLGVITAYYVLLLKNNDFEYENEIRMFSTGTPLVEKQLPIKYRINNKRVIIPYVEEYFPKTALKEVWIGPTLNIDLTVETLREFLDSKGFEHTKIVKSKIPYRG